MRRSILLIFLFALISARLTAQSYGLGNADPSVFSKYRVPETNLSSLYFNTQLEFNSYKNHLSSTYPEYEYLGDSYTNNLKSSLTPSYYLQMQNDDKAFILDSRIGGNYNYDYNKRTSSTNNIDSYSKQNELNLNLYLKINYRSYFKKTNLFYSINPEINVDIIDRKYDTKSIASYQGTKSQNYNLNLGVGWGRIRDVTPVVSAIRFQERLKMLSVITNDLNEKTIEDLAEQFSKQSYYSIVHERESKYFWQDIEKTLINNNISLSGLNQYGTTYLMETPSELRLRRREGFITGINLQLNYDNSYTSSGSKKINENFNTMGNIYIDYSHQLDLNSQVKFSLSISGGPNVIKGSYERQKYIITSNLGYDYELTDRIIASILNKFEYDHSNIDGYTKYLRNDLKLSMNYFIEDNLLLSTSYEFIYDKNKCKYDNVNSLHTDKNSNNYISLGFTYYIDKGFLFK